MARWLHRHGEAEVPLIHQISREVIAKTLGSSRVKRTTLNNKAEAQWTYLKQRGFMSIIGTIAESGQVIAVEFRDGNVPPYYGNAGLIKTCQAQLPDGVKLRRVRIDAAQRHDI